MDGKIQLYQNKEDCFGCMACVAICPKNAITVQRDEQGFDYPIINYDKCVSCGACINACQCDRR